MPFFRMGALPLLVVEPRCWMDGEMHIVTFFPFNLVRQPSVSTPLRHLCYRPVLVTFPLLRFLTVWITGWFE